MMNKKIERIACVVDITFYPLHWRTVHVERNGRSKMYDPVTDASWARARRVQDAMWQDANHRKSGDSKSKS